MSREYMAPEEIEKKSMEIIERELNGLTYSFEQKQIIKRVIHTTCDVEFGKSIIFHPQAIAAGLEAIKSGKRIITDVHMVEAGIRAYDLTDFGNEILCFFDKDKNEPNKNNLPRAVLAMRKAQRYMNESIIVIGNAPTALFEVVDMIKEGGVRPVLVIGIPVGFVGAAKSKEELSQLEVPYITNKGRKGGSTIACAIINALIKLANSRL